MVSGDVLGFNTANPANGELDAASGQTIYYSRMPTNNIYLEGGTYPLKSGGRLRCMQGFGTIVTLQ
jgi:hypothetical protein